MNILPFNKNTEKNLTNACWMNKWLNEQLKNTKSAISYADKLKIAYLISIAITTVLWIITSLKHIGPSSH